MKNKMNLFAAVCVLSLFTACGVHSEEVKTSGGPGALVPGSDVKAVTDLSSCSQGASAYHLDGTWGMTMQGEGITLDMTWSFRNGSASLTNHCTHGNGRSLVAYVSTSYVDQNGSVTVLRDANESEKIDEPGFQANCNASIRRATFTYSFRGSCLELHDPSGQVATLVPAY